jgi:glycosyltransferase involved in cell wall biosynthesis
VEIIGCSKIAIVPSLWEEPMGGVALELLAAGLNIIVSEKGGHAECVGEAGLKFKNGDVESLYKCMVKILEDDSVAKKQIEEALKVRKEFDEEQLTKNYIDLYWSIFKGKKRNLI